MDTTASYDLGHNQFSTWTQDEYEAILGFRQQPRNGVFESKVATADDVDWRDTCVTPVKDQGSCGSCWAFSTTGSIEGANCAAGNGLVSLSEQELVDCDTADGNAGCNGGDMLTAMKWTETHALANEADYPYKGTDGTCKTDIKGVVECTSEVAVATGSESALTASIEIAPTSVAIDANALSFQLYKSGLYDPKDKTFPCGTNLDHGVLAVGYGYYNSGAKYYIVKNSWNTTWGDQGYIYFLRDGDGDGTCGIQMDPARAVTA